ncbi:MAG TPA: hypothetical protein DDX39_06140 [Bacteroidales bacterium]|nr:MAG: hypothetical protein A2W98_00685 [Bacteroidetes bacterium GWF2_33_38]OFY73034.1 MAG: hypothetical protein A2265_07815 [Bacteroidetes bacterium RIFOXYA12_FULL_33_9]OFY86255.1 MAG: hypothetical protein A2236_12850 [Bacteroidetes bacterium RIFOXYA2_FULL_33_7]HBF88206.1 hypothetical protein [Bacteroidales bacterium]
MIAKYIVDFLKENNRLIIPELGAFIVKINHDDNSRSITFNDVIKFNDNTFANFIATKENIVYDEAVRHISEFVHESSELLSTGQKVKIETVGNLQKDGKGYVVLILEEKEINTITEIIEKQEVPTVMELIDEDISISNEKVEDFVSDEPINENEIMELIDHKEDEKNVPKVENIIEEEIILPPIPEIKIEEKKEIIIEPTKKESEKVIEEILPEKHIEHHEIKAKIEKQKPVKPEKAIAKKSNKLLIILVIVGVLVIGAGVLGFMFKEHVKAYYAKFLHKESITITKNITVDKNIETFDSTEVTEVVDTIAKTETIIEEAIEVKEEVIVEKTTEVAPASSVSNQSGLNVHLIAGSFQVKSQADKYAQKIISEGFDAKVLDISGSGWYRVTFSSFATENEAKTELENLKAKGKVAWILKD